MESTATIAIWTDVCFTVLGFFWRALSLYTTVPEYRGLCSNTVGPYKAVFIALFPPN